MQPKDKRFISLRWRLGLPLLAVLLVVVMFGAYLLAGGGMDTSAWRANVLLENSRLVNTQVTALAAQQGQRSPAEWLAAPDLLPLLNYSAMTELVIYRADGVLLQTTFPAATTIPLPPDFAGTLQAQTPPHSITIEGQGYQAVYLPVFSGGEVGGVIGVLLPDDALAAGEISRQISGLLLAVVAGVMVIAAYVVVSRTVGRVEQVTRTAEALAAGQMSARASLSATDEIGRLGQALNQYADAAQERHDLLRTELRRQRREVTYLISVLESLPDGIVVLDQDGHVMVMNAHARELLGSQQALAGKDGESLTAIVTDMLGPSLAPGIYALGSPLQLDMNGRLVSAQAAAVMTLTNQRVGTVVVLRDITDDARRERMRDQLLAQIAQETKQPLESLMGGTSQPAALQEMTRELTRHTVSLQKLVLAMRELTDTNLRDLPDRTHQPIPLDNLVWSLANEWKQTAQASNLTLHVVIEKNGLYVLGNERRLRWALGNLIDNAIKYTPPGGDVTLEIRKETGEDEAHLRIRDNGVGIAPKEMAHVFERFYRGEPVTREGRVIRAPGTGQGLSTARQIIETHGGTLALKSKQWMGTAAFITLPLTSSVSMSLPEKVNAQDGDGIRVDTQYRGRKLIE